MNLYQRTFLYGVSFVMTVGQIGMWGIGSVYGAVHRMLHSNANLLEYMHPDEDGRLINVMDVPYYYDGHMYRILLKAPAEEETLTVAMAVIWYKAQKIDVTTVLQQLRGPHGDFHGVTITGEDILAHYISETPAFKTMGWRISDLCDEGVLEIYDRDFLKQDYTMTEPLNGQF